jgi:hypothetical protein
MKRTEHPAPQKFTHNQTQVLNFLFNPTAVTVAEIISQLYQSSTKGIL